MYQTSSANNTNTFIPGDTNFSGSFTLETEIILPRKSKSNEIGYFPFPALTASVLGFHSSGSHPVGYTHPAPASDKDLSIYVIRESLDSSLTPDDSQRVRFMVTGAFGELTSSIYNYQYENNKWNVAARVRHANYPYGNITGNIPNNYLVEFYGVEADSDTKRNSFYLTSVSMYHILLLIRFSTPEHTELIFLDHPSTIQTSSLDMSDIGIVTYQMMLLINMPMTLKLSEPTSHLRMTWLILIQSKYQEKRLFLFIGHLMI